jgi:hypothetical protein
MGKVVQFPERKPDKISVEQGCRFILSESALAGRYPPNVEEQAIKNVVAVADHWWSPKISLDITPQVDFTQEQLDEVIRICKFVGESALAKFRAQVVGERLLHELQSGSGRPRPRAA